jgi:hypothetical protein
VTECSKGESPANPYTPPLPSPVPIHMSRPQAVLDSSFSRLNVLYILILDTHTHTHPHTHTHTLSLSLSLSLFLSPVVIGRYIPSCSPRLLPLFTQTPDSFYRLLRPLIPSGSMLNQLTSLPLTPPSPICLVTPILGEILARLRDSTLRQRRVLSKNQALHPILLCRTPRRRYVLGVVVCVPGERM